MKKIIILAFLFIYSVLSFAQKTKSVAYELNCYFQPIGTVTNVNFKCLLPRHLEGAQQVDSLVFSQDAEEVFYKEDNIYARFVVRKPHSDFIINVKVYLTIFENDLNSKSIRKDTTDLLKYTMSEMYLESDHPEIKSIASRFLTKSRNQTVKGIYNYVSQNVTYTVENPQDMGALYALRVKKGDCTEFADLFVALCRANNIPARVIEGVLVKNQKSVNHNWAEVYFEDRGWVTFDPTAKSFAHLDNEYIQLTNNRTNQELDGKHYWFFKYWGDSIKCVDNIKGYMVN